MILRRSLRICHDIAYVYKNIMTYCVILAVLALILSDSSCATLSRTHEPFGTTKEIIVVNVLDGDDTLCQEQGRKSPCKTLEGAHHLLKRYGHEVTVSVETDVNMTSIFDVVNMTNIYIIGSSNLTPKVAEIRCTPSDAGFRIDHVENFSFSYLSVVNCNVRCQPVHSYSYAMVIIHSTSNVFLENVFFTNCRNTALVLINNSDQVILQNVTFENNRLFQDRENRTVDVSFPGALALEHDERSPVHYIMTNCSFIHNESPRIESGKFAVHYDLKFKGRGYGGAVFIVLGGNAYGSSVVIQNSTFINNTGNRGGAIYAYYESNAANNRISIETSSFHRNEGDRSGGAVNIGYENSPTLNTIHILDCNFTENHAIFGGGLTIYFIYYEQRPSSFDSIIISGSIWENNRGILSSAVDIAPLAEHEEYDGYLSLPQFINCTFKNNSLYTKPKLETSAHHINTGIFSVSRCKVLFGGKTVFSFNNNSAVVLVSGQIEFQSGSDVLFHRNEGYNGGAVVMYGFSKVILNTDSFLNFSYNHAVLYGGAIFYHTIDQHEFVTGSNCFISHRDYRNASLLNETSVIFEGNVADVGGNSIFAESFRNCYYRCISHGIHFLPEQIFICAGKFQFMEKDLGLTSSGNNFIFEGNVTQNYDVFPGSQFQVPFYVVDDFNRTIKPLMSVNPDPTNRDDIIKVKHTYTLTNSVDVIGNPSTNSYSPFTFSVIGVRQIFFYICIHLLPCPPGFYIKNGSCECASGGDGYSFVTVCNDSYAYVKHHLWIGYIQLENSTDVYNDTNLYSASCPFQLCRYDANILPNSSTDLNGAICRDNREGILCGRCVSNRSSKYHSRNYFCGYNDQCYLGILFYLISEIFPMVVFFVVVVTFEVSFTSGGFVGFIFFSQQLNLVSIPINHTFTVLSYPYRVFYGLFNFDFFEIEVLSFCLWKDAQILDVIAFKYVTMVIGFGLVLTLTAVLHNNTCSKLCHVRSRVSDKTSVVHGLSAFLIICYAQCTKISYYILNYVRPVGYKGKLEQYYSYYGGLPYKDINYMVYLIPALFSLIVVTIFPLLILVLNPLALQILSLFGLSEHWTVNRILKITFINRLKPFFDCFQSCYKDKLRVFAGLHFVYRMAFLLCFTFTRNTYDFSIYSEILLVIMLGIHSTFQPYRERLHNIIESLILFDLALINACVIVSKDIIRSIDDPNIHVYKTNKSILIINSIQLILLYLPMVVFFYRAGQVSIRYIGDKCRGDRGNYVPVNDILEYETERNNMQFSSSSVCSSSTMSTRSGTTHYGTMKT